MEFLKIKTKYKGVSVDAKIIEGISILRGHSGTGKTFFMEAAYAYCQDNNISCIMMDYKSRNLDAESIKNTCKNMDVVLLDNADLYLTPNLLKDIIKTSKYILICIRHEVNYRKFGRYYYIVKYEDLAINLYMHGGIRNKLAEIIG